MKNLVMSALVAGATMLSVGIAEAGNAWTSKHTALNARSGPGTSYHVKYKFPKCTKVYVIKWQHGWAKVKYNGKHYWVSGKYLRGKPCNAHHNNGHGHGHAKYHTHHHKHGHGHGHTHKHKMHVGHH